MIIAEIIGRRVEFDGANWKADDPEFVAALADMAESYRPGPLAYEPNPDFGIVQFLIDHFGSGRILSADEPESVPGRVY